MSQPDPSENGKSREPFDGYDDVAEGITEPHSHAAIPTSFAKGTGRRLAASALLLTVGLGGAYFYVNSIKAKDRAELAAATEAKVKQPPMVEAVTVTQVPAQPAAKAARRNRGLVSIQDLRTGQRIHHEVVCRYRRQGEEGSGSRDYRHART